MLFSPFTAHVKAALGKLYDWLRVTAGRLADKIPPEKRRLVLTASLGFCAVLVLVLAGASLAVRGGEKGRKNAAAGVAVRQETIPADDLFLPDEPDFVPGVLLEREQRTAWTADDAAPLWQDPLRNGEEPWRDRIERTIDEIMESIP